MKDAWAIIDVVVPHLEAKLARVTGHPDWRFAHLRSALDVLRTPRIGRGGSGDVAGSQHSRDCVDESCRTPVEGRHARGEEHHCGVEEEPFVKFSAFELAALASFGAGLFAEDERDAFFFGA